MKPLSYTLAVLALLTAAAAATTYYVDPAGSNLNNGLSPQMADWASLIP